MDGRAKLSKIVEIDFVDNAAFGLPEVAEANVIAVPNVGWYINVFETNLNLEKRVPVEGQLGVGQLIARVVDELGK